MGGRRSANGIQQLARIHRVEQQPFPAKRTDELCDWRALATLHSPVVCPAASRTTTIRLHLSLKNNQNNDTTPILPSNPFILIRSSSIRHERA